MDNFESIKLAHLTCGNIDKTLETRKEVKIANNEERLRITLTLRKRNGLMIKPVIEPDEMKEISPIRA